MGDCQSPVVGRATPKVDEAVKWGRLTFTVDGDWHHWLCGIAATERAVNLTFHKGALLDDPTGLLHEAVAHHHDMLDD